MDKISKKKSKKCSNLKSECFYLVPTSSMQHFRHSSNNPINNPLYKAQQVL